MTKPHISFLVLCLLISGYVLAGEAKLVFYALASENAPINAQVLHLVVSGKLGDISGFNSDNAPYASVLTKSDFLKELDKVSKRGPFTKEEIQELEKIRTWVTATPQPVIGFQLESE